MKISTSIVATGLAAGIFALPAIAAETVAKFEGAIGVDPVAGISAVGVPVLNVVHGINPGGRPWVMARLKSEIKDNGHMTVKGEGLLLAGSDAIGTIGPIQAVGATLFCGTLAFDSGSVPIDANGDFRIDGPLSAFPPTPCPSPVLLIRNATGGTLGAWFAAGIPAN